MLSFIVSTLMLVPTGQPAPTWKPCPTEDATTRCVWDARHMGNGKGDSFVVTRRDGHAVRTVVSHSKAHYLLTGQYV